MMTKKRKFFKNLLASSAIASVVISLGSGNVALEGASANKGAIIIQNTNLINTGNDGVGNRTWQTINNDGTGQGFEYNMYYAQLTGVAAADRPAISYNGNFTLDADMIDSVITTINLTNHNPGLLTVSQNLSIGSIVPDAYGVGVAARLPIKIKAGHTLTSTGTKAIAADHGFAAAANTYTGLGNVELGGAGSTLGVQAGYTIGAVTTALTGEGILSYSGAGSATGNIGINPLRLVRMNIGNGEAHLQVNVFATTTRLTHENSILKLAAGKTITGAVWNDTGVANKGVLTFEGDAVVTGDIGAIDPNDPTLNRLIHQININALGKDVILGKNVYTEELQYVNVSTVKIGGNFVGAVNFNAGGTLEFNGAVYFDPVTDVVTKISRIFDSTIQGNGTLNVNTSVLVAINVEIGGLIS